MSACDIFIDTNLVLHFQPIEQIDWCALTQSEQCTVVIAPILLRELEQKKIFSPSTLLKTRAGRMIDFLVEKMALPDPIDLRPGVHLAFAEHEPALDFAAHNLVREVNDDQYIASAIAWEADQGRPTLIASNDGGMALKLRSRSVGVLRLPEALRLPVQTDPLEKELRDAKAEIARMKSRRPKLLVRFADGSAKREILNARAIAQDAQTIEQIRAEYPSLPLPAATSEKFNGDIASIGNIPNLHGMGSRDRVESYNAELIDYYERHEKYLAEIAEWTEMLRLSARVGVTLHNEGGATATNVDVTLRFPETVRLFAPRDWPEEPEAPRPPRRPGTFDFLESYFGGGTGVRPRDLLSTMYDYNENAPYISDDDPQVVEYSAKSIKQKCELAFDRFLLLRSPALTDKGIEVEVIITFHEGEPVHHKLALTFREVDAELSDD